MTHTSLCQLHCIRQSMQGAGTAAQPVCHKNLSLGYVRKDVPHFCLTEGGGSLTLNVLFFDYF